MCPSYAFKAYLTRHWEMYALREAGFCLGIVSNLYIIPCNTRIRGLGGLGFLCIFFNYVPLQKEWRRAPYFL